MIGYVILPLIVLAAVGVGVGISLWVRKRFEEQWARAWAVLETHPALALTVFERLLRVPPKSRVRRFGATRVLRAKVGETICLLRLGRLEEAKKALAEVPKLGRLTDVDHVLLCRAYLTVPVEHLPERAINDWALLLTLPGDRCPQDTRREAEETLRKLLSVGQEDPRDRVVSKVGQLQVVVRTAPDLAWAHYQLGVGLARLGKWQEAVDHFETSADLNPGQADAHRALGRAYRQLGDDRRAQESLVQAHRLAPGADAAQEAGMACLDRAGRLDPQDAERAAALGCAIELFSDATKENPVFADAWLRMGQAQRLLGRLDDAISALQKALLLDNRSAAAHAALGECFLERGQRDKARAHLRRACKFDPDLIRIWRLTADLEFEDGNYRDALALYRHVYDRGDADEIAVQRLARCYLERGQPDSVVHLLKDRDPLDLTSRLLLGRGHARLGDWGQALATLDATGVAEAAPEYRYYLASAKAATGQLADAERLLRELAEEPAWSRRARRQLGHVKLLQGDKAAAGELYASENGDISSAMDLGRLELLTGTPEEAKVHFARAAAQDKENEAARFGLAYADAELGDLSSLRELAERASTDAIEELADRAFDTRRYLEALQGYERAAGGQTSVSTRLLSRMVVGYLQLRRYGAALPHLVELHRRQPEDVAVRRNLAVCRFHLGRSRFSKSQWEAARRQFERAVAVLQPIDAQQAAEVRMWQLEAGYREAVRILQTKAANTSELMRACELFEFGCQHAATEGRWFFGAGVAFALVGDCTASLDCFAKARRLMPDHVYTLLGLGLSLHSADQGERARDAFREAMRLLDASKMSPECEQIRVATRFALAMSHAHDRQWSGAAAELQPLLTHPLIQNGKRITPQDVAQAAVAYYASAGDKGKARDLTRKYLKDSKGLGDVLIGLVQADAGDYEAAAKTLGQAFAETRDPKISKVLVACVLAIAARAVREHDLKKARHSVDQALRYQPSHGAAQSLRDALDFARNLNNLDLSKLEEAIEWVRQAFDGGDRSPQLIRSLAAIYHRKAVKSELRDPKPDAAWQTCVKFWREHVFENEEFWGKFVTAYNAGKSRRERLKEDDVASLRESLRAEMASYHVEYAGDYLSRERAAGLLRHLALIWEWNPHFDAPEGFLLDRLPSEGLSESVIKSLQSGLRDFSNVRLQKAVNELIEGQKMKIAIPWFNQGCAAMNQALEVLNRRAAVFAAMAQSGLGYGAREVMKDAIREALSQMREARALIKKAYDLVPSDPDFRKAYEWAKTQIRDVEGTLRKLGY